MKLLIAAALAAAVPQDPSPAGALPSLVWADFDRDGYEDALALHAGALSLFRNAAAGHDLECAAEVGLSALPALAAAGWIDYDRDGHPDLFAVTAAGAPLLLRNESGVAFLEHTAAAGLALEGPVLKAEWHDVEGDGEPDLVAWTPGVVNLFRNVGGSFEHSALVLAPPAGAGGGSGVAAVGAVTPGAPATSEGAAAAEAPRGRTRVDAERAGGSAATPGPGSYTITPAGAPPPSIGMAIPKNCAKFVYDQSTGSCIVTSSVPALGQLYPLSTSLNVDSSGRVGMGTTFPTAQLHVSGGTNSGARIESAAGRALSVVSASTGLAAIRVDSPGFAGFFDGRLEVGYNSGPPTFQDRGRIFLDLDSANSGTVAVRTDAGVDTFTLEAEEFAGNGAEIDLATYAGTNTITLDAENGALGALFSMRMTNGTETVQILAEEATSNGAQIALSNANGDETIIADANTSTGGAELAMYMVDGTETVRIVSNEATGNGAEIALANANGVNTMVLDANTQSTGGAEFSMHMVDGTETVQIRSNEATGNGAEIALRNANGTSTLVLDANTVATGGSLFEMFAVNGQETVELSADEALGTGARLVLRQYDGTASIILDANLAGDGRITTDELQILGGADLVESFDTGDFVCEPGTVVVIDVDRPGELRPSTVPYDTRVAGVVSGAGGVNPGIHMGQEGVASGSTPVALTGRVYVRCTAENGPVRPGDLLTTSSTEGTAMRATDTERSFGTVIGKAMTTLEGESGLVLTLVNLQ